MNGKRLALALATGATLLAATGAQAHDGRWDRGYHNGHYRHYGPRVVVQPAYPYYYAPRYVAPAPVYYAPPPPVYYRPAPAVYGQIPVGHHATIGFSLPLY
jgi:hypothetical protein